MLWTTVCGGCGAEGRGRLCATCAQVAVQPLVRCPDLLEGAWGIGQYDVGLGHAVRRCKGTADRALGVRLGRHLAAHLHKTGVPAGAVDLVTWAPSPWTRRATRGFNLAAILATAVGRSLRTPTRRTLVLRPGARQASASAKGRADNLRGRLRCIDEIVGNVLIVDDVTTTGATLQACARELLGSGATKVWGLTCCVVPLQENSVSATE